jgi:dihydroxy-acid dehydratase
MLHVSKSELISRRKAWRSPRRPALSGVLEKYALLVGPANHGAVTHSGGKR